ncbi:hypothetical protein [Streptomyces sp. NBC_01637]|uniref:nSTAND3 domain-containing NTPase n=1 Tax=unclassified Streptomyces TaxID=2593676 RepID=UPI00386F34FF|nr:hypothetical protein OH719_01090 [Streptomyces sp. NBC_01653]WTC84486.1 hypothetical protein OH719_45780 [Streptomyces sp. NBC_01653]WTD86381.1 hypothetical protein OG891_01090 [Streptomyces sp. NBC_01637]WTD94143.1 hypothetical protein OG891_45775 [Streptomyces sp. NBC_01637]
MPQAEPGGQPRASARAEDLGVLRQPRAAQRTGPAAGSPVPDAFPVRFAFSGSRIPVNGSPSPAASHRHQSSAGNPRITSTPGGCPTVKTPHAAGLVTHWNPHEPNQIFWIDDTFGNIRHDRHPTDNRARHMRKVMTAVHGGAQVVLTSHDYNYRNARRYLKEPAYLLLHEQQIVVDAALLSPGD